ncbi:MAG: hypothetical protein L0Y56_13640 [Nitrospira sp.]|nr:hypothetical protein [Nitrospira sp.]
MIGYINNASGAILPGTPSGLDTSLSGFGQIASRPGESSFYEKVLGGWGLGYIGERLPGLGQVVSEDQGSFFQPLPPHVAGVPGGFAGFGGVAADNYFTLQPGRAALLHSDFQMRWSPNTKHVAYREPWGTSPIPLFMEYLNTAQADQVLLGSGWMPGSAPAYVAPLLTDAQIAAQKAEFEATTAAALERARIEWETITRPALEAKQAELDAALALQAEPISDITQPQPSTTVATIPTTREFGAGRGTTAGRGTRMPNVVVATPGTPNVQLSEEAELGGEPASVNQESFSTQAQEVLGMVPGPSVEIGEFQIPWLLIGGVGALLLIPAMMKKKK